METKNSLMENSWRSVALLALLFVCLAALSLTGKAQNPRATYNRQVTYNTLKIDDLEIFYREAIEFHLLDTGHFALEEEGDRIAQLIQGFLAKQKIR